MGNQSNWPHFWGSLFLIWPFHLVVAKKKSMYSRSFEWRWRVWDGIKSWGEMVIAASSLASLIMAWVMVSLPSRCPAISE